MKTEAKIKMIKITLLFSLTILVFSPKCLAYAKELKDTEPMVNVHSATTITNDEKEKVANDAFLKITMTNTKAFKILEERNKKIDFIYHTNP